MEFKVFAKKLKNVIGGASNTIEFTKTLFETMMNDSGSDLLASIKPNTFKAYFNGNTSISKISALVLANLNDDDEFSSYLDGFGETTAQLLADEFQDDIPNISASNASAEITNLFLDILRAASGKQKSASKSTLNDEKTPHDILTEKILASGQAVADAWGNAMNNLASQLDNSDKPLPQKGLVLKEDDLNEKDAAFLDRFRNDVEPILLYCIEHDPAAEATKITLADEIIDFVNSWKFDVRKIKDNTLRSLVFDTMQVLSDYTYYLSDKFLRLIPQRDILWFRNESGEEGEQLRNVLQPESYKKRCEIRDIYLRLYPIPEEASDVDTITIPEQQPSDMTPYSPEDNNLLREFTSDYDEIMLKLIGDDYASALIDMSLPTHINSLYMEKWSEKANSFQDPVLKSNVFGLLGELNALSNSFSERTPETSSIKRTRIKIRNLYVKLHPDSFAQSFPYDAFIDDWNEGEI